jgi:hypothetical protein
MTSNTTPPNSASNPSAGLLGRFGLATVLCLAMFFPISLTAFYPPWSKVDCKRRQTLYWSERTEIHSTSFAGFDFLFSKEKWHREQTPPNPGSDTYFESIEYQITYPVLFIEWLILLGIGIFAYIRLSKRIFVPLLSNPSLTNRPEPSSPPKPSP